MNDLQRARVRQALNTEAVRRMLVKYFVDRDFHTFDEAVNPVVIQDLPFANQGLDTKIEIEPFALDIDPTTSRATLGWNLFVLGNQRMFLGETYHENLLDLARQIRVGQISPAAITTTRRCTTPRRIIMFIERMLKNRDGGYVDLSPRTRSMSARPRAYRPLGHAGDQSAQFYTRSSPGM